MGTSRGIKRNEEQLLLWSDLSSTPPVKKKRPSTDTINKRVTLVRIKNIRLLVQLRFNGDVGRLTQRLSASHSKTLEGIWLGQGSQNLHEKSARRIEAVCGLDKGWLDLPHPDSDSLATKMTVLDGRARRALTEIVDALLHPS